MDATDSYPTAALRIAAVAFRSEFGDVQANLGSMLDWMDRAADHEADLVCFPEIALQGYCSRREVIRRLAEPIDGPSCTALARRARELDITVSFGISLREGPRVYNSQVFFGPDGMLGLQHKVHLLGSDRGYDPGVSWDVVDVEGWKIGTNICFDANFPEAARVLALKGADVVLMSFATGRRSSLGEAAQPGDWVNELMCWAPARAFDNRVFVVGVNHAGDVEDRRGYAVANHEGADGIEEWAPAGSVHRWPGYCFAISPRGRVCAESDRSKHDENVVLADLDPAALKVARTPLEASWPAEIPGHFLAVRRADTFGEILSDYDTASTHLVNGGSALSGRRP